MANRNAKHLAYEVNTGKKDVSFLPRDFDVSLLAEDKRELHLNRLQSEGYEPPKVEHDPLRTVRHKTEPTPDVTE